MRTYTTPPFEELPESMDPTLRWVDSMLVDKEQYLAECWEVTFIGPHPYWRASSRGMEDVHRASEAAPR